MYNREYRLKSEYLDIETINQYTKPNFSMAIA